MRTSVVGGFLAGAIAALAAMANVAVEELYPDFVSFREPVLRIYYEPSYPLPPYSAHAAATEPVTRPEQLEYG